MMEFRVLQQTSCEILISVPNCACYKMFQTYCAWL